MAQNATRQSSRTTVRSSAPASRPTVARPASTVTRPAAARRPLGRDKVREEIRKVSPSERPFFGINFLLMAGCVLLIVVGFLLMLGPGSSVEGGFNPDIFSTRRIAVGPTITFLGFLLMAFAIFYTPRRGGRHDAVAAGTDDDAVPGAATEVPAE